MSKSAPPAPDYIGAANAQSEGSQELANQQNYANRPNVTTPWGSQTWDTSQTVDPSTGKPVTQWNSNVQLSPEQQAALDSQLSIQQGRSQAAETLLGQATSAFQQPANWDSLPQRGENIDASGLNTSALPSGAVRNDSFNPGSGPEQINAFGFGDIQRGLNGDSSAYRDRAQDAITQLQAPMLQQRREQLESQLANQGLARGTQAWDREMMSLRDQEDRAHLSAIGEGRNESAFMFGQDLQAGQFRNQAQAQAFGQGAQATQLNNQAAGQEFAQNQGRAAFENQSGQAEFTNLMELARQGDARAVQALNAQIAAGNFNNQNRQGAIQESALRRSQSLNELNALLTGQQVNMPQFQEGKSAAGGQTADLMGAMTNQYGGAIDAFNAKQSGTNQAIGSAAMMAAMYFSDERLKENIETVGRFENGCRMVAFDFKGVPGRYIGVIAQELAEIQPDAVVADETGFLMVDYSKVQ